MQELIWLRKMVVERALTRGDYVLSGGVRSDYYIDKFRLFSDPHVLRRIARLFTPMIAELNPDLIAGTELGRRRHRDGRFSNVGRSDDRRTQAAEGLRRVSPTSTSKGRTEPGNTCCCVEDVVTPAASCSAPASDWRSLGLRVTPCAVISRGLAPSAR